MTVSELIDELKKYDGNKEVCIIDVDKNVYDLAGINDTDYLIEEFGVCLEYE